MHDEARRFVDWCMGFFGPFAGCKVLDVGSGDINGNNRRYFDAAQYVGCDVAPGKNVDLVCPCHELPFVKESFDVIVSTECFEHDMHYEKSLQKIAELLKPGGVFVFTCASTGRPEHGTARTTAGESLTTGLGDDAWASYYKNLTALDVAAAIPVRTLFPMHAFFYNPESCDLYFWGIKALPVYT